MNGGDGAPVRRTARSGGAEKGDGSEGRRARVIRRVQLTALGKRRSKGAGQERRERRRMRLGAIHAVGGHLHHPLRALPVLAHSYAVRPAVLRRGTLAYATRHRRYSRKSRAECQQAIRGFIARRWSAITSRPAICRRRLARAHGRMKRSVKERMDQWTS